MSARICGATLLKRQAGTNALRFGLVRAKFGRRGSRRTRKCSNSEAETPDRASERRRGLDAADPATLLLVLVQLTGERHWLEAAKPFIRGPMNYQEFMPEPLRAAVRDRLAEVLAETRAGSDAARGRWTTRCCAR